MSLFYNNHQLHLFTGSPTQDCSSQRSAKDSVILAEQWKECLTPFYVYDLKGFQQRAQLFKASIEKALPQSSIHYAMKANDDVEMLKIFRELGYGVDVVSGGELQWALDQGFSPKQIVFSGVGKTVAELQLAIDHSIKQINVESPAELKRIAELSKKSQKKTVVAFRLNPDVDAQTHPYISTGFRNNKFGMDISFMTSLIETLNEHKAHLELTGLTIHIGSQLQDVSPILEAIQKSLPVYESLKRQGFPVKSFDIGGGVGVNYETLSWHTDFERLQKFCTALQEIFKDFEGEVLLEPGRFLVGRHGFLISEVQYIKKSPYKNFAILDTGMHHLMRPCLYQAYHNILPLQQREGQNTYDLVGPICESSDVLGTDRLTTTLEQGDRVLIADVGAYGQVMSSGYNRHKSCERYYIK